MSHRLRVYLNIGVAVIVAVGVVVGLTLDTRTDVTQPKVFPGKPPVPTGLPAPVGGRIEEAYREWPHGSINLLQQLGLEYSKSALVQYYRGFALMWAGYNSDAAAALQDAKTLGRNTIIQGRADNLLHPQYYQPPSGAPYPVFQPLEANPLLSQGSALQQEGHQESAETLYARAARKDPNDAEARVAAAVGLFDEDNVTPSFAALGELTARFPKSQVVHYYLGFLLAWTNQASLAVTQFEDTVKLGPKTTLGKAATSFLEGVAKSGANAAAAG